ncbi:hypothetical protein BDM02DRAFT_2235999 [Thelephora ganbajun]|uniref:Uncharacterized protein n=1 Tax=Thelephora ganbajun TaxID=370292 RepID=A0ACB6ZGD5_THEGA|nr:hypothetical protein BDM02DRAFT_2235999 [Thelephora ganbajun]
MFIPTPLKAALEDSISSGKFIDTKFWVFSQRNRETGRLEKPRAVFANSTVVRSIPYLSALLDEVSEGPLDADFPQATEAPLLRDYEYQSDSDLDSGTARDIPPIPSSTSEQDPTAERSKPSLSRLGRTVIIRDAAFVTFHAVLVYLCTKEIEFRTIGGIGARSGCSSRVPPPSARSVYRLADKYRIPDLRELALLEIRSDIKKCNIVEESFQQFVSWYPEIQELYMHRLAQVVCSSDSPGIAAAFDTKIQEYFAGKLPHAKDLVLGLFDLLASSRVSPHPSPSGSSHSTITPYSNFNHGSWSQLRDAIIGSLTTGVFLDSIFYMKDSTELRPLFFCSSVIPASIEKISVPMDALQDSLEQVTPRGTDKIAAQDVTSEKVPGDFRT